MPKPSPPSWTIAVRLPLFVGVAVFLSAVGTTHLALHVMGRELDREITRMAEVYIDSLAGAVLPALVRDDRVELHEVLERGLGLQRGVTDLGIVVTRPDGAPIARVGDPQGDPPWNRSGSDVTWTRTDGGATAWVQRELVADGEPIALIAAQLAFPEQVTRRNRVGIALTVADLVLAALAAVFTMHFARRLIRPFAAVTAAIERAGSGRPEPLPPLTAAAQDAETSRLVATYNLMVERLRDRQELAARLEEQERAAVLGRLAATVAHEVRNPLAGMLTALDTIRRFGADAAAREHAVSLVERGLMQIEAVVRTTLATHREAAEPRPLSDADLEDLKVLVQPEARRRGVELAWRVDLRGEVPTDAVRVRQIVLNLLLNAVTATRQGGRVTLEAGRHGDDLVVAVEDEAGGLPPELARRLGGNDAGSGTSQGLGIPIAARLVESLAGRIEVEEGRSAGTRIVLHLPARREGRA
jgi:signal transduction histidine kinase